MSADDGGAAKAHRLVDAQPPRFAAAETGQYQQVGGGVGPRHFRLVLEPGEVDVWHSGRGLAERPFLGAGADKEQGGVGEGGSVEGGQEVQRAFFFLELAREQNHQPVGRDAQFFLPESGVGFGLWGCAGEAIVVDGVGAEE